MLFLSQFLAKCKKVGVFYVGLLWSYSSSYSITLFIFSLGAYSQEDMSKQNRLTGGMQRADYRTVVFYQQKKGSVWLNLLDWSEPQKKNNDYYQMTLGALLWFTIPSKTIIKIACVGPDGLTWARNELRFSINHEFHAVTKTNNGKVIFDM